MQILQWNLSNLHKSHILRISRGFPFLCVLLHLKVSLGVVLLSFDIMNHIRFLSASALSETAMAVDEESRFHVLAVDDSIIDRKLIEALLRVSSYKVTAVDSGREALKLLGLQEDIKESDKPPAPEAHYNHEIDVNLIITDYFMPGMTGYDLLRRIKDSECYKDIPVVIMSSENVPSRISRCLEEGAEEFFLKPVRLSDVSKLRPHLERKMQGIVPANRG